MVIIKKGEIMNLGILVVTLAVLGAFELLYINRAYRKIAEEIKAEIGEEEANKVLPFNRFNSSYGMSGLYASVYFKSLYKNVKNRTDLSEKVKSRVKNLKLLTWTLPIFVLFVGLVFVIFLLLTR
jgi:hypothetical protein